MARLSRRYLLMLANELEPHTAAAFAQSFERVKSQAQISRITSLLRAGQIQSAVDAVGLGPAAFTTLTDQVAFNYDAGIRATAEKLPILASTRAQFSSQFGRQNPLAQAWIQQHSTQLVTNITNDQRDMMRTVMFDGMRKSRPVSQVALDLVGRYNSATGRREGGLIGLTKQQAGYVVNAREQLETGNSAYFTRTRRDRRYDSMVAKAIKEGKPLTKAQVDKITGRYADRLLETRGKAIAATETVGALHAGQRQAFNSAIGLGLMSEHNVRRVWRATLDHRTRDSHWYMSGETAGWEERFSNGLLYPGEYGGPPEEVINCRCWLETYTVF